MKYVAQKKAWIIGKHARLTREYKHRLEHSSDQLRRDELKSFGHLIGKVVATLVATENEHVKDEHNIVTLEFTYGSKVIQHSFALNAVEIVS